MYQYSGALWLWFRTGLTLGLDGKRGNPDAGWDPNDPHGSEMAFRHGWDVGAALRHAYHGAETPPK